MRSSGLEKKSAKVTVMDSESGEKLVSASISMAKPKKGKYGKES
jgi:hypothetical protein